MSGVTDGDILVELTKEKVVSLLNSSGLKYAIKDYDGTYRFWRVEDIERISIIKR